ncbi:PREDICTED: monocarboxylate transporter 13-like [Priapulus caudatus]|uniref:Monocarboxylate transporter 13-like n=1 Tax=Priapulus caudatus TaxID=37621 RepID=A0ABM1F150_PRICU|nr:PREDICTED: monocarboxylate transporter 13-like [Priapulus caudatus]
MQRDAVKGGTSVDGEATATTPGLSCPVTLRGSPTTNTQQENTAGRKETDTAATENVMNMTNAETIWKVTNTETTDNVTDGDAVHQLDIVEIGGLAHTDHGWAWMVLVGASMNMFVMYGAVSSFPVLFVEFVSVFGDRTSLIALVGSLQTGMTLMSGPVFSRLSEKYGYRLVVTTGGMLATAGMCISYAAPADLNVLICAYGLMAGIGRVNEFYTPSLSLTDFISTRSVLWRMELGGNSAEPWCDDQFGRHYLQSVAAGALFREIPQSSKDALAERRGEGGRLMMPLTNTKKFVLHCMNHLLNSFSLNVLVTFGVLYGVRQGLSLSQAALMITVLNICNVVLQFVVSSLADRSLFFRRIVFVVATIIIGVTYFLFLLARELWVFVICCVLYGCAYGARASLETTMLVDLFGIQNLPMVQAFYLFSYGLGGLVGPLAAGFLVDYTEMVKPVFILSGVIGFGSAAALGGVFYIDYKQSHMPQESTHQQSTETVVSAL